MVAKKSVKDVSSDIKDVAKELAMLDANPAEEIKSSAKETAKKAAKKATEAAKETAKRATTTAKETAKKASSTAKETAKKATVTAKETAKKATEAAKTTVKKVAAKPEISKTAFVEYAGNQYTVEDIIERCEAKYKAESKKKAYKDIKVYIKPENNAAYYVVDGKSADKIDLI